MAAETKPPKLPPGMEIFYCQKFAISMPMRDCIRRIEYKIKAHGEMVKPLHMACCSVKNCAQGAGNVRELQRRGHLHIVMKWIRDRLARRPSEEKKMDIARRDWKLRDSLSRLTETD